MKKKQNSTLKAYHLPYDSMDEISECAYCHKKDKIGEMTVSSVLKSQDGSYYLPICMDCWAKERNEHKPCNRIGREHSEEIEESNIKFLIGVIKETISQEEAYVRIWQERVDEWEKKGIQSRYVLINLHDHQKKLESARADLEAAEERLNVYEGKAC